MNQEAPTDLGPCCACEKRRRSVRNILCLKEKAPVPGTGWGCVVCGLSSDGALAVVCDDCLGNSQPGGELATPLRFACRGFVSLQERVPIGELQGTHEHDLRKHPEAALEKGHHQERALVQDLGMIRCVLTGRGYELVQQKKPIAVPAGDLRGEVDFCLRALGEDLYYVVDAKSCSPGIYNSIETAEDLWEHRRWFVRQWPIQLLLYLLGVGLEADRLGLERWYHDDAAPLLLKDKVTGDLKPIPVPWQIERVEALVDRLETINVIVKRIEQTIGREIAPDFPDQVDALRQALPRVLADPGVCPRCPFHGFCAPELSLPVDQLEILDNPDLEGYLESRQLMKQAHELYDEADANAKALLRRYQPRVGRDGKAYFLVGSYLGTVTLVRPKGKAPYFKYVFWRRPETPESLP